MAARAAQVESRWEREREEGRQAQLMAQSSRRRCCLRFRFSLVTPPHAMWCHAPPNRRLAATFQLHDCADEHKRAHASAERITHLRAPRLFSPGAQVAGRSTSAKVDGSK